MTAQLGEYDTFGENGFLHRSPSPVSVAPLSAYLAPPRFSDLTLTLHAFILYATAALIAPSPCLHPSSGMSDCMHSTPPPAISL